MNRLVIYAVPALLLFGGLLILSKGRVFSFYNYLVYSAPYEGNTAITKSVLISTESGKSVFISNPDFQDFSRRSPDFDKPLKDQINAPHTAAELQRYGWLVGRVRDKSPGEVVRQVYAVHLALRHSGRKIDPGVIGGNRSAPEDYIFYVANAETACGTVSEAVIAILKAQGYKTRLVILAHDPAHLVANHVLLEYFDTAKKRWVMLDPTVGYVGTDSVLNALSNNDLSNRLNKSHGIAHYKRRSTILIDQRGGLRNRFYYSSHPRSLRTLFDKFG
jgi:hypothetical protein